MRPHLSTQVDQEEEEKVSAVINLTLGLYYAVAKNDAQVGSILTHTHVIILKNI